MVVLGLCCRVHAFSGCSEWEPLFVEAHGLLIAVTSLVSKVLGHRFRRCGTRAELLHGIWDLPGSGVKPVSPALAD